MSFPSLAVQARLPRRRGRFTCGAALAAGAVLAGVLPASSPASAVGRTPAVTLRLTTAEAFYRQPMHGTFVSSGAIADRGTVSGLFVPVYRREPDGSTGFDTVRMVFTGRGGRGSFTLRGRADLLSRPAGFGERGTLVVVAASGAYRRLAPFVFMRGVDIAGPVIRATRRMQAHLLAAPGPYLREAPQ